MGTDGTEGYLEDGEGPVRSIRLSPFKIAPCTVTNADFLRFVFATGYVTDAERYGWSFVFEAHVAGEPLEDGSYVRDTPWWIAVKNANWAQPEGGNSNIDDRMDHPVVHVTWFDAKAFCRWSGTRLPTEAEWECSARGGLEQCRYPWGDEIYPGGEHHCNIWQGDFPTHNTMEDGFASTAPVDTFQANGYGLYNVSGNVWEWCEDWFSPDYHQVTEVVDPLNRVPSGSRSMRGGSFLCHHTYCNRYRVAARSSNTPESSTNHTGFRVAADGQVI